MLNFLENIPKVFAVMSEREDGSMKLSADNDSLVFENRAKFFRKVGIDEGKVISAGITHSANVKIIEGDFEKIVPEVDGLIVKNHDIFLSVTIADCVPVYLYEPEQKIIGLLHCGWRGIISGIIENAIGAIVSLDGETKNLRVALGPGINKCHFEIKNDVLDKFSSYPEFIIRKDGKIFIDLKGIMEKQLVGLGVPAKNIENESDCTMENARYFSFRRDKPKTVEAMIAIIGLRSKNFS